MMGIVFSFITGGFGKLFGFLRSLSPQMLIILALVALCGVQTFRLGHTAKQRDRALAGLTAAKHGIENVRVASLQALEAAKENKVRVETQYVKVKDNAQIAIADRLRSELDRLHAAAANQGGTGATGMSGPSAAPADPLGRDQATILDDTKICTTNTVMAEGWQETYGKWKDIDRGDK